MNQPLLQSFIDNGVTGELCLTSNLQTKAAPTKRISLSEDEGSRSSISINTDNRTVSDTGLTKEYALYHQRFQTKELTFTSTMSMPSRLPLLVKRKTRTPYQTKKPTRTIYKQNASNI